MAVVRDGKGKSRLILPRDYCVIDIETTGLSPSDSEIIEIAAVKYRENKAIDTYSTFVKPKMRIPRFITGLTGITNEMVKEAPDIFKATIDFYNFISDDIIIGYNINFDINFLYDALQNSHGLTLKNDFVDVLRFARKALPELNGRSQTRVADYLNISYEGAHRAVTDCEICNAIYQELKIRECIIEMTKGKTSIGK